MFSREAGWPAERLQHVVSFDMKVLAWNIYSLPHASLPQVTTQQIRDILLLHKLVEF